MNKVDAFFLDFDGTLIDSLPPLYTAYQRFVQEQGSTPSPEEFESLLGPSIPEVIATVAQNHNLSTPLEELLVRFNEMVRHVYTNEARFHEGVEQFLKNAKQRKVTLLIVSSAPGKLIEKYLSRRPVGELIDAIISPEGLVASKPDPAIYKKALQHGQWDPTQVLAFEDTPAGIASATGAGIRTVCYGERSHYPNSSLTEGPFLSWAEIEAWLGHG